MNHMECFNDIPGVSSKHVLIKIRFTYNFPLCSPKREEKIVISIISSKFGHLSKHKKSKGLLPPLLKNTM